MRFMRWRSFLRTSLAQKNPISLARGFLLQIA